MTKSNSNLLDILQMYADAGVDETLKENHHHKGYKMGESDSMSQIKAEKTFNILSPNEANMKAKSIVEPISSIDELEKAVKQFDGCALKKTATNTVFADGVSSSKIMFIGEAPGANEDIQGIPFCGDSGKLLDKILYSIGLSRKKNAYITNTIFWRPPGNRKPTEEEMYICKPFVEKHIALVNPKLIVMVGSTASFALFGDLGPVTKQRQKIYEYNNQYLNKAIPAIVTFHPSYLLRQSSQKKLSWDDMLFIKKLINK